MPSKVLEDAVGRLVDVATGDGDDQKLRAAVNNVVKVFDSKDTRATKAAIGRIATGLEKADGRAAQVLLLTLGALVESGAAPDLAWPPIANGLLEAFERATRFADACLERAASGGVEEALAAAAVDVAERRPRDAAAWREVPSRCLSAIACLTRSRKLRSTVRKENVLIAAALPLAEAIDEVGLLLQVLRILDDEPLIVVHPPTKRAFRVAIADVASNVELLVLLADAIVGDGKDQIPGKRPDARAVALLKDSRSGDKAKKIRLGIAFEKPARAHHDPLDGVPADFPEIDGARVVVMRDVSPPGELSVEASFPALAPELAITATLDERETEGWLTRLRPTRTRAASPKKAPKKSAAAKPRAKTTRKPAPKRR